MALVRAHLIVKGEVQGVFYRASAREEAMRLGIFGWVRNLPDGDVEAEAEGPEESVQQFIRWCRRGPPTAVVSDVQVETLPHTGEFKGFGILR
jgi:acylphosphatase